MKLSQRVLAITEQLFSDSDAVLAKELLIYKCGNNVPHCEEYTLEQMDRIRLAAIKSSGGDFTKLKQAVSLANTDWRDLLMAVGFGHDIEAHNKWVP
jgi:hypothetical protein